MIRNFLGYREKPYSYVKPALSTFWINFWNILGYFFLQHLVLVHVIYHVSKINGICHSAQKSISNGQLWQN